MKMIQLTLLEVVLSSGNTLLKRMKTSSNLDLLGLEVNVKKQIHIEAVILMTLEFALELNLIHLIFQGWL